MAGRIAIAAVFLSFLVACLMIPQLGWAMVAFIAVAGSMCILELRAMFREHGVHIEKRVAILGVVLMIGEGAYSSLENTALALGLITTVAFASRLRGEVKGAFHDVASTIGVVTYIGLPCAIWASLFLLGGLAHVWCALTLAVVFLTDSFALFVGKAIGKHKLIPSISPGKTIEGSLGGLGGAIAGTLVAYYAFPSKFEGVPLWEMFVFAGLFCVVTQVGDLAESMLKRDAGVKDSGLGKLLNLGGHGGFLDMLDAVLFTGIPLFTYLKIFHPEVLVNV